MGFFPLPIFLETNMARKKRRNFVKEFNKNQQPISQTSRRNFNRIRDGVENGETGVSILRRFRSQGIKIRTQEFYRTYRHAQAYDQAGRSVKFSQDNTIIGDDKIPLIPSGFNIRGNYQYIIKLKANSPDDLVDGERKEINLTVRSAQPLSKSQVKEQAALIQDAQSRLGKERYDFIDDNFTIDILSVYRRI